MDTYSLLREIADSWGLLGLVIFFLGTIVWAFRPGSTQVYRDTADIPFRNDDGPLIDEGGAGGAALSEDDK